MPVPHDPNEFLAVVDERDNVIEKATRKAIHERGLLHREVGIFIYDDEGRVLIQKRRDNGKLDFSAAGHVAFSSTYEKTILKEAMEEIGLSLGLENLRLLVKLRLKNRFGWAINNRFLAAYAHPYPGEHLNIDEQEVEEVYWLSLEEVIKRKGEATAGFRSTLEAIDALRGAIPLWPWRTPTQP